MAVFDGVIPAIVGAANAAGGVYEIERSLRFNSADSAYLDRTPASASNQKTWTWAGWVKRSAINSNDQTLFSAGDATLNVDLIRFDTSNRLDVLSAVGGISWRYTSSAVYRDPSAWLHCVVAVDTTNSTAADRVKIYINGIRLTEFDSATAPSSNYDNLINSSIAHAISYDDGNNSYYFDGYLADVHFIDGQALAASNFGAYDDNNVWQPKAYSGSYGTNGFHLDFSDNSSASALGTDSSGNSNTWTVNNLSVASGAGNDSLIDTPTDYEADSGNNGGNYATLNPLQSSGTLSNGNLELFTTTSGNGLSVSTIAMSNGKYYWEVTLSAGRNYPVIGIVGADQRTSAGFYVGLSNSWGYQGDGNLRNNDVPSSYGNTYSNGAVIGVAFDADTGSLYFYKNGVAQNSGTPATTSAVNGPYLAAASDYNTSSSDSFIFNFGQRPFAYTPPTGYLSLCTTNLDPTIADSSTVMDVTLYTGDNTFPRNITGLGFSPDFVWTKIRSQAYRHMLFDTVRGAGKNLTSNNTDAETTNDDYGYISAFNSDGWTIAEGATSGENFNANSETYVAWAWDAGSSTVSNTDGTITSQVRANQTAGFSIVTYTGTGSNATVGHGLNAAPSFIIVKRRDASSSWPVYHSVYGGTKYILLNGVASPVTDSTYWQNTAPTSSVFSVGTSADVNASGGTYVAYCFAPVSDYSAFGRFIGNGNVDGPFIHLGFKPALVLFRRTTGSANFGMMDAKRFGYNIDNYQLFASSDGVEVISNPAGTAFWHYDIVSNGFKVRTNWTLANANGSEFIYAAFAENPFKTARAR